MMELQYTKRHLIFSSHTSMDQPAHLLWDKNLKKKPFFSTTALWYNVKLLRVSDKDFGIGCLPSFSFKHCISLCPTSSRFQS